MIVILTDVNVLIYAHREDAADHPRFRDWIEEMIARPEAFGEMLDCPLITADGRLFQRARATGHVRLLGES